MLKKPCRIAALLATLAAVAAMAVAAAPASAEFKPCSPAELKAKVCLPITAPFIQYHVNGSLVTGGQTITLPPTGGAFPPKLTTGFTGYAIVALRSPFLTSDFNSGSITNACPTKAAGFEFNFPPPCGNLTPPFTQEVEFPKGSGQHQIAGMTTVESPAESGSGEFHTTAASNCPSPILGKSIDCILEEVNTTSELGYSVVGPGKGTASKTTSQCETTEPVKFALHDNLTFEEFAFVGSRFVGSTTVPSITCTGKNGNARGSQMTETFSGPATYSICVQPVVEPPGGPEQVPPGCPPVSNNE